MKNALLEAPHIRGYQDWACDKINCNPYVGDAVAAQMYELGQAEARHVDELQNRIKHVHNCQGAD